MLLASLADNLLRADTYARDSAPEEFGAFSSLVALWQRKRGGHEFPRWADFDIPDFRGWYGLMYLGRVLTPRCEDVVFELHGSELATWAGRDMTGCRFSESCTPGKGGTAVFRRAFRKLWKLRGIDVWERSQEIADFSHIQVRSLHLVMGKADHEPTHVAAFHDVLSRDKPRKPTLF